MQREAGMGFASYAVITTDEGWGVLHNGEVEGAYATKEAAFESAVMAATLAVRSGHEVHVSVPSREGNPQGKFSAADQD